MNLYSRCILRCNQSAVKNKAERESRKGKRQSPDLPRCFGMQIIIFSNQLSVNKSKMTFTSVGMDQKCCRAKSQVFTKELPPVVTVLERSKLIPTYDLWFASECKTLDSMPCMLF